MTFPQTSGSPHHFLAQLAGGWTGTSKIWLEPDKLLDEAPIIGNIQLVLDARFALFLYQTSVEGETQHGMFTFGYNTTLDRYEASWLELVPQQHGPHVLHRSRHRKRIPGPWQLPRSHRRTGLGLAHRSGTDRCRSFDDHRLQHSSRRRRSQSDRSDIDKSEKMTRALTLTLSHRERGHDSLLPVGEGLGMREKRNP